MDEDEIAALAPAAPAPGPADSDERPEIVRFEFPITVVVVGSLSAEDLRRLREAVIADLVDALDEEL